MFGGKHDRSARQCKWNDIELHGVVTPQWTWEIEELANIYAGLRPERVLEIGTFNGGTTRYWMENAAANATVVTLDCQQKLRDGVDPESGAKLLAISGDSHLPETCERVQGLFDHQPLDFLFIDGDHTLAGAKDDFVAYGPLVRSGGLIAFHDICPNKHDPENGVWKLWDEIQQAGYLTRELLAVHAGPYGGIGLVYVE